MWWPKYQFTSNPSFVEYKFIGAGWLYVLSSSMMQSYLYIPYLVLYLRGQLKPLLPLVSEVAAIPPESGIFSVLVSLSAIVAFISIHLLYMFVRLCIERSEKNSKRLVNTLNIALLITGYCAILGRIIIGANAVGFYRNKEEWFSVILLPHIVGEILSNFGEVMYCILFTYIMSTLQLQTKNLKYFRIALIVTAVTTSWYYFTNVKAAFLDPHLNDLTRLDTCIYERWEYNSEQTLCAISQWINWIVLAIFQWTIREEAQHFTLTITVTLDESIADEISKPALANDIPKGEKGENDITEEKGENDIMKEKEKDI